MPPLTERRRTSLIRVLPYIFDHLLPGPSQSPGTTTPVVVRPRDRRRQVSQALRESPVTSRRTTRLDHRVSSSGPAARIRWAIATPPPRPGGSRSLALSRCRTWFSAVGQPPAAVVFQAPAGAAGDDQVHTVPAAPFLPRRRPDGQGPTPTTRETDGNRGGQPGRGGEYGKWVWNLACSSPVDEPPHRSRRHAPYGPAALGRLSGRTEPDGGRTVNDLGRGPTGQAAFGRRAVSAEGPAKKMPIEVTSATSLRPRRRARSAAPIRCRVPTPSLEQGTQVLGHHIARRSRVGAAPSPPSVRIERRALLVRRQHNFGRRVPAVSWEMPASAGAGFSRRTARTRRHLRRDAVPPPCPPG